MRVLSHSTDCSHMYDIFRDSSSLLVVSSLITAGNIILGKGRRSSGNDDVYFGIQTAVSLNLRPEEVK